MATAKSSVLQLSSSFQKHVHQQQVPGAEGIDLRNNTFIHTVYTFSCLFRRHALVVTLSIVNMFLLITPLSEWNTSYTNTQIHNTVLHIHSVELCDDLEESSGDKPLPSILAVDRYVEARLVLLKDCDQIAFLTRHKAFTCGTKIFYRLVASRWWM
eukprot:m.172814 g.172814  ORF g.172814 m.172814 type:complete len:156 (-) comp13500_c1_seq89:1084-1551(-)